MDPHDFLQLLYRQYGMGRFSLNQFPFLFWYGLIVMVSICDAGLAIGMMHFGAYNGGDYNNTGDYNNIGHDCTPQNGIYAAHKDDGDGINVNHIPGLQELQQIKALHEIERVNLMRNAVHTNEDLWKVNQELMKVNEELRQQLVGKGESENSYSENSSIDPVSADPVFAVPVSTGPVSTDGGETDESMNFVMPASTNKYLATTAADNNTGSTTSTNKHLATTAADNSTNGTTTNGYSTDSTWRCYQRIFTATINVLLVHAMFYVASFIHHTPTKKPYSTALKFMRVVSVIYGMNYIWGVGHGIWG
jgi:hypothetical protein